MEKDEFIKIYKKVFSSDGSVKSCGREECKKLIRASRLIDNSKTYGDETTGFMDVSEIKELFNTIAK